MLTKKMQTAIAAIESLAPAMQDHIAAQMLDMIDDHRWRVLFADPRSSALFGALIAQDETAILAGDAERNLDELLIEWDRKHR